MSDPGRRASSSGPACAMAAGFLQPRDIPFDVILTEAGVQLRREAP
ncbi:MAG: hypothetical protein LCH69_02525 [Proteobacteria bacterium]|nr:hypothetical protein [Pseudomonadota bacterium]